MHGSTASQSPGGSLIKRLNQKEAICSHPSLYRYYDAATAEIYFKNGGYMLVPCELWSFALSVIYRYTGGELREALFRELGEDLEVIKRVVEETEKQMEKEDEKED